MGGGGIMAPQRENLPEQKINIIPFSYACFLKKLYHFHDPVKSHADFVGDG